MSSHNYGGDRRYRGRDPRERSPGRHSGSTDEPRITRTERSVKCEMNKIVKLTDVTELNLIEAMVHLLERGMSAAERTKSLFQASLLANYPESCKFRQTLGQHSDWRPQSLPEG